MKYMKDTFIVIFALSHQRAILKWGVYVADVIQRPTHNLLAEKAIWKMNTVEDLSFFFFFSLSFLAPMRAAH